MANTRDKDIATQAFSAAADDFLRQDGATNGTRKISPFDRHGQFRNALAARGGVAFDGSANTRVISTLTNQNIATDACALSFFARVPTSSPAAAIGLAYLSSSATTGSGADSLYVTIENGGQLRVAKSNAGATGGVYTDVAGLVTNFGGKWVHIVVVRNTSGNPAIYLNCVAQTISVTSFGTSSGAFTDNITSSYLGVGFISSTNIWTGLLSAFTLYNLALSQSDVLEIFELGGAVPERFKFGTQDVFGPVLAVATSSNLNYNVTSVTGISATGFTVAASGATQNVAVAVAPYALTSDYYSTKVPGVWRKDQVLDLAFTLTVNSGGTPSLTTTGAAGVAQTYGTPAAIAAGANTVSLTCTGRLAGGVNYDGHIGFTVPSASNFTISGLLGKLRGALVYLGLDDGLGLQPQDASTNRLHALMSATGVTHIAPLYGPARVRTTTNTNGNQQLLGGTALPATCQILRVRARAQTGTPSVTLGTASGGSQVVASVALSTTWKDLTIALTGGIVSSASSLWAGSGTTDVVEWDIHWEPLSP